MRQGFCRLCSLCFINCSNEAAGFPAVAGHALSAVIGCKFGLAASAIVPAGEFFIGIIYQQRIMCDGTFEEILVVAGCCIRRNFLIGSRVDGKGAFVIELEEPPSKCWWLPTNCSFIFISAITLFRPMPCRAIIQPKGLPDSVSAAGHQGFGLQIKVSTGCRR